MRVLFLIHSLVLGGAQRQLVVLARGLKERGHDVSIVVFYPGVFYDAELADAGIPVSSLRKRGRWDLLGPLRQLSAEIRGRRAEVVHSYLSTANIFAMLLRPFHRGVKFVWGIRSCEPSPRDFGERAACRTEGFLSRFAHLIIFNSGTGRERYFRRKPEAARSAIVANGIDTEAFAPDPAAGAAARERWGLAAGTRVVGLVSRPDPVKDLEGFFAATALLHARDPSVRFVLVCEHVDSDYGRGLEALARPLVASGALQWLGPQADMRATYNAFDVSLLTSRNAEGFPNTLAEALACGVPCVSTDAGDSASVVGSFGRIVPRRDPERLARAIEEALADRARHDAAGARAWVIERFSPGRLATETEALLRRVSAAA